MRCGRCIKDGVRLIKTYIIDNILTWLFLTISRFQEIHEFLDNIQHLKNIKQMLDSYRIFQRGNAANSKKGWFEFITHKKPRICDEFISFHEMTDADVMSKIIDSKYERFHSICIFGLLSPYLKTMNLQNDNLIFNDLHSKTALS